MLEVPDVDCGVIVFALFYCHLDLCCGECYVGCLQFECVPILMYVCFVCFMFDCVAELFVEFICYVCGRIVLPPTSKGQGIVMLVVCSLSVFLS